MKRATVKAFMVFFLVFAGARLAPCIAADVNFEISCDRRQAGLGQPVQLNLTFNNGRSIPAPELPEMEGFQWRYLGPATSMSVINGVMSSSVTHMYSLLPQKKGAFRIGPFKFDHDGDTYLSNSFSLEVVDAPQSSNPYPDDQVVTQDLSDRIFLVLQPEKNKAYLNEVVPVTVKLYVNRLGVRDIQFPQVSHEGFSLGEFGQPRQYREIVGGIPHDVIEFSAEIFGLKPGEFRLGPADLRCNLVVRKRNTRRPGSPFDDFFGEDIFQDFFGGYEAYPYSVKSPDIPFTVLALPEADKPESFRGAMGEFTFEAEAAPAEVRVGDPVTFKVTVSGEGNLNTVSMPSLAIGKNFKAYEPQVKQDRNAKTFEQVLIPLNADVREVPAVSFSFFDTASGQYKTITRGPFSIAVSKPEKMEEGRIFDSAGPSAGQVKKEEELGKDIVFIKDTPGRLSTVGARPLYQNPVFLGFQAIPLMLYLLILAGYRRDQRLKTDTRYARGLLAPRKARAGIQKARERMGKGNASGFYDALFGTLQEYLGDKFHLPSKALTAADIDELKGRVPEDTLAAIKEVFAECDRARYASSQVDAGRMPDALKSLEEIIDRLQRIRQ